MKPKLFLFSFALFTAIFAYQHAQALPDQVQIVPNSADQVQIINQKVEISSGSFFQIISTGPININAPAGFTREPLLTVSTGTTRLFEVTSSSVVIRVSSSVIIASGNLGIGTVSPNAPLHILANTSGNDHTIRIFDSNSSVGQTLAFGWTGGGVNQKYKAIFTDSVGFNFGTLTDALNAAPNPQLVIANSGEVSVGTVLPEAKFHVHSAAGNLNAQFIVSTGTIKLFEVNASSIVARLSIYEIASKYANPDYVFSPSYSLMDMASLRKFLSENKHLTGVYDSKHIEKHGINLGERAQQLLEKLEESYLYILNLEERITKLEQKGE